MDITVQLALMEKLRAIFSDGRTFTVFPRGPLSFRSEDLHAIVDGASTGAELQVLGDWTRAINPVPTSERWLDLGGPFLWDVLDRVLRDSSVELASGTYSSADQVRMEAALRVLYRVDVTTGHRQYSDKHKAYKEYEEVWNTWVQAFRERRIQVSESSDPRVRQHWNLVERPVFETRIKQAENDWDFFGFRSEIEQALDDIQRLGAKSPRQQWRAWQQQLSLALDGLGDLNQVRFVSTGFSPINFMSSGAWPSLVLEKSEISALIALIPRSVLNQFSINLNDLKITRVAFEFTSVSILRSWFPPEMFSANFWRFRDRYRLLSNGALPPNGELPGYVDAVVFIRNLVIDVEKDAVEGGDGFGPFPNLRDIDILLPRPEPIPRSPVRPLPFPPPRGPVTDPPFEFIPLPRPIPSGALPAPFNDPFNRRNLDESHGPPGRRGPRVPEGSVGFDDRWRDLPKPGGVRGFERRTPDINSIRVFQESMRQSAPRIRTPGVPSEDANEINRKLAFADGKLGVVAYVCKAFPRCPDPDARLNWTL